MNIEDFSRENRLQLEVIGEGVYKIAEDIFILIKPKKDNILVDKDFNFIISKAEKELSDKHKATQFVFDFGGKYYCSPIKFSDKGTVKVVLNDFKYLGKSSDQYNYIITLENNRKYKIEYNVFIDLQLKIGEDIDEETLKKLGYEQ